MEKRLYFVTAGKVWEVDPEFPCDWENECLVLAYCDELALLAAKEYDAGRLQHDNAVYCGINIVALQP